MPKDKTDSHILILENAKKEFLMLGFEKASMRSIAKKSGLTGGALYKHFKSKEDMFNALVEPAYSGIFRLFDQYTGSVMEDMKKNPDELSNDSVEGTKAVFSFVYENFDEFRLMFNCSAGTKFENIREAIVDIEVKSTKLFIENAKKNGFTLNEISDNEIHIFATMSLTPMFEVITHGYEYDEAVRIVELMSQAQNYAWEKIINLRKNDIPT